MSHPKKGALHQVLVPMVDSTDFASIESAITESNFNAGVTKKFYGWNTGGSAATTSGTISKAGSLVRSGVFRITLKTTENNYDMMMCRFNKTGCAEQIMTWSNVDNDDSDIMSFLSDFRSDFQSRVPKVVASQSQVSDLHSDLLSFLVVMSDALSDLQSDFQSRVPKLVATNSQLSDLHSDLRSFMAGSSDTQSKVYALLSDFHSDFQSRVPKLVATNSQLSDVASDLRSFMVVMSDVQSNINSLMLAAPTKAQLVSAVWASGAGTGYSDAISNIRSAIAAGPTATMTASDISNIASAVWAEKYRVHSLASSFGSLFSLLATDADDTYSLLSDLRSDFQSRVPKLVATNSQLSDLASDLASDMKSAIAAAGATITASDISNIASAVWSQKYHAHSLASSFGSLFSVIATDTNNVYSLQSNVNSVLIAAPTKAQLVSAMWDAGAGTGYSAAISDIRSAITAGGGATISTSDISNIASAVWSAKYHANSLASSFGSLFSVMGASLSNVNSVASASPTKAELVSAVWDAGAGTAYSDVISNLRSAISAGPAATITASDISNIASAVWGQKYHAHSLASSFGSLFSVIATDANNIYSLLSNVNSLAGSAPTKTAVASAVWANTIGARVDSRVFRVLSDTSQIDSLLSEFRSDFQSRVPKRVATDSQLSDLASDLKSAVAVGGGGGASASAVWANAIGARVDSRVLRVLSDTSRIDVVLSDFKSDFQSRVPKLVATQSQLSDLHSDLRSYLAGISDVLSDLQSDFQSRVPKRVATDSQLSDMASDLKSQVQANFALLSDFQSDFSSRVPKRVATDSQVSDLTSDIRSLLVSNQAEVTDIYSLLSSSPAEPGAGSPSATATFLSTTALQRAMVRNKRATVLATGVTTVYADDGVTPLFTFTTSEAAGIVTRTELA